MERERRCCRKRKRQCAAYDPDILLPGEEMKDWMEDVKIATREADYTIQVQELIGGRGRHDMSMGHSWLPW